ALGDDAENPRFIETLPRYGYRLITLVEIVETNGACPEVELPPPPPRQASPQPTTPPRLRPVSSIIVALLAIASLALLFFLPYWRHSGPPPRNTWVQITNFSDS